AGVERESCKRIVARSVQIHWRDLLWCLCESTSPQTSADLRSRPLKARLRLLAPDKPDARPALEPCPFAVPMRRGSYSARITWIMHCMELRIASCLRNSESGQLECRRRVRLLRQIHSGGFGHELGPAQMLCADKLDGLAPRLERADQLS